MKKENEEGRSERDTCRDRTEKGEWKDEGYNIFSEPDIKTNAPERLERK